MNISVLIVRPRDPEVTGVGKGGKYLIIVLFILIILYYAINI